MNPEHRAATIVSLASPCLLVLFSIITGCNGFYGSTSGGGSPSITTQPSNQTVTAGQTATFTVVASGTAPLSYQWQKNGANISGATSSSYTTPATTTSDSGSTFKVVVSNSAGTATSNSATLIVNAAAGAPTITTQPSNQTVTAGQTATFTVVATGTAPLSYQWQKNGSNISGATSASYTTPATTTSDSGSTFKVVVTNSAGSATSNSATLTVNAAAVAPTITTQPSNQTVTAGQTATFTVVASGTAPLSYQWQKNGANISGATSASYTTPATTTSDSGSTFKVVVTNSAGSATSNAATLTVNPSSGSQFPIKASASNRYFVDQSGTPWMMVGDAAHHLIPAIAQSAVDAYLSDRVTNHFNTINLFFLCAGAGTCPTSGAAFDGTLPFTTGTGPTTYDLSTPNQTYWAEVDAVVNAAAAKGLVVLANPIPWGSGTQMFHATLQNNGATKAFNFGVFIGNRYKNSPNIIWHLGQDFQTYSSSASDLNIEAQLMAGIRSVDTNHLLMSQLSYPTSYSSQANSLNSTFAANLTSNFVYEYHETYDFVLQAYNNIALPIVMGESNYENGNNLGLLSSAADAFITRMEMWWPVTSGATGYVFGNEDVNHFDSVYLSNLDTTATLQVKYVQQLLLNYQWWTFAPDQTHAVVTAGYGTYNGTNGNLYNATYATTTWDGSTTSITYTPVSTTLTVNLTKFSAPSVTASWYDPTTGTSVPISGSPFPNTGTQTFTTPTTAHADGTHDWVLVLDPPATTSTAPTITTQPANQTVTAGQTATFTVVATGTAPLSYQWQKNNANISGATSASYTTPATTTADSGSTFKVVVSNSAGSATSNAATLTVNAASAPAIAVNPTSISFGNVVVGANVSQSLIISNTGNATLTITQINVTGATFNASGYTLPFSVNAGGQTTITVAFLPTAVASVSGSVSIVSNAPTSPTSVGVSGSGIAATLTLGINPTSLSFGNVLTGTTSATQNVTITNSGNSNVTISQISVSAGYTLTGGSTPVTLTPSQNLVLGVQFAPTATGSVPGSISITSNAAGSPVTVTLSGTGVLQHTVSLSWTASTSTVSGYNVYRSTSSGTGYVKINSSLVSGLTYTDSNVSSGTTYFYVTTAVDSSGLESTFSNQATAVIP